MHKKPVPAAAIWALFVTLSFPASAHADADLSPDEARDIDRAEAN